jgi:hypothetical protein
MGNVSVWGCFWGGTVWKVLQNTSSAVVGVLNSPGCLELLQQSKPRSLAGYPLPTQT